MATSATPAYLLIEDGEAEAIFTVQYALNFAVRERILDRRDGYTRTYRWHAGNGHQVLMAQRDVDLLRGHIAARWLGADEFLVAPGILPARPTRSAITVDPDEADPERPWLRRSDGTPRPLAPLPDQDEDWP
jgi:hypothetical protein